MQLYRAGIIITLIITLITLITLLPLLPILLPLLLPLKLIEDIVSVLERDEGYTVKYNPLPEGVPEGEAQGNS